MNQMQPPNKNEREMLKRKNLNPDDYLVKQRLNYVVVLKHKRTGVIKYLEKRS